MRPMIERWSDEQLDAFASDGFLVVEEGFVDARTVSALRERFARLFRGEYETGLRPDEVNWVAGRDPEDRTRQHLEAAGDEVARDAPGRQIEVEAGGAAFHHHRTFHGSGPNTAGVERRAVVSHLVPAAAAFHPEHVDPVYSRYRRFGDTTMDESFFPVVWSGDGGRSAWLDRLAEPQLA